MVGGKAGESTGGRGGEREEDAKGKERRVSVSSPKRGVTNSGGRRRSCSQGMCERESAGRGGMRVGLGGG